MSAAIKKLHDYLAKSPSVVYPEDVLAYLPAIEDENVKLRELVRDMLMCLTWQYEPHGYMEDGCNCCRFRGKTNAMCGLGMFKGRASETGVEVDW